MCFIFFLHTQNKNIFLFLFCYILVYEFLPKTMLKSFSLYHVYYLFSFYQFFNVSVFHDLPLVVIMSIHVNLTIFT